MSLFLSIEKSVSNVIAKSINNTITSFIYTKSKDNNVDIPDCAILYKVDNTNIPKKDDKITNINMKNIIFNDTYLEDKDIYNHIESVSVIEIKPTINLHPDKVVIFSRGRGKNNYTASPYLKRLADILNIIIISYDYPGYGDTKGIPTEKSCVECLNIVVNSIKNKTILLIGYSLGTGVVIDYISKNGWNHPILLIAPYKSIPRLLFNYSIIDNVMPEHCYQSINKCNNITCPVKIVHGEIDYIIPISHGKELYESLNNKNISPTYLPNTGHTDILYKIDEIYIDFVNM